MQPDITFFGEKLTDDFDKALAEDRDRVDLLLVIGTSLKVSPVAELLCAPLPLLDNLYKSNNASDSPPSTLGTSSAILLGTRNSELH